MTRALRLGLVPGYLLLCLLLGGASAAGFWANMLLQLLAIPIIGWALIHRRRTPVSTASRQLIGLVAIMVAILCLQLVPLPPAIWTLFPGRESVAQGLALLGQDLPWMPISLAPLDTVASGLWLLPAVAVLFGIVRLGYFKSAAIAWVIAVTTAVSVAIGALQLAGGETSPWYIYQITNYGQTTGFFSNSNHMATLLVAAIPFITALYVSAVSKGRSAQRASGMMVILGGTLAVVVFGIFINSSLAGIGLSLPVAAASVLMIRARKKALPRWAPPAVVTVGVLAIALIFSGPFGNNLTDSQARTSQQSRYSSFGTTIAAAADYMPLGSGTGTFVEVYRTYENPEQITRTYMNHAHSDYLELALETGIVGIAFILLFLFWWVRRTIAIWAAEKVDAFALAATVASGAILAHSVVDYPLRTAAIAAIFAACCALMAEPRIWGGGRTAPDNAKAARHLSA